MNNKRIYFWVCDRREGGALLEFENEKCLKMPRV
jgi:hypothetical protein